MRRHFWVLGLGAFAVCAVLAYSGWEQLAAARDFDIPTMEPIEAVAPEPIIAPDKSGDGLVSRNIFCSTCSPLEADDTLEPAGDAVPLTALPLALLATSVAISPDDSFATVRRSDTGQQGAYGLGDRLPGAGEIQVVGGTMVVFHNPTTGRLERLSLLAGQDAPSAAPPPRGPRKGAASPGFADRIRRASDTRFEVDAELVKELTANPMSIKGVRFMPHMEGGKVAGFKLRYARQGSIATAMGLRRGDVVQSINGLGLSSADALLDIYTKLRDQSSFEATVVRGGKPVTMRYDVR